MRKLKIQRGEALKLGHRAGNWQSYTEETNTPKLMSGVWEVEGNQKHNFLGSVSDYNMLSLVLGKFAFPD